MSHPRNTVLNGPSSDNIVPSIKDAQPHDDNTPPSTNPSGNEPTQPAPPPNYAAAPRPPLPRLDSRGAFPLRPSFPSQPGLPLRPQQVVRQPSFLQRPPPPGARPPGPFLNPGAPRAGPHFRPPTPFPRPPLGQRPLFQQRSMPGFGQQRPPFDGELARSHTLDSTSSLKNDKIAIVHESAEAKPNTLKNTDPSTFMLQQSYVGVGHDEARLGAEPPKMPSVTRPNNAANKLQKGAAENVDILNKNRGSDGSVDSDLRSISRMGKSIESSNNDEMTKAKNLKNLPAFNQKNVEFNVPMQQESKNHPPEENNRKMAKDERSEEKEKLMKVNVGKIEGTANLHIKHSSKPRFAEKSEGDNDSGVDESTAGNESSNGDHNSPRKSAHKGPSRTSSTTPTKSRSLSRGSKSPSLKSPDSNASTPSATEKKKLPMNKIQVGSAPSPNLKVVRSKIGSLDNASYRPGGGHVKIENRKIEFKGVTPRIEAKNDKYMPKGGDKKIQQQKLQWNAKSKIGSLDNASHKPKGGEKKIESMKLDFKEKAKPKIGSKDNIKYVPGGGDVKIETKKLDIKVQSKVGSLDNVKYRPGGGDKKIFDDKDYLKQTSAFTSENHSLNGSQNSLPQHQEVGAPIADVNLNQQR